jgi:hypothetical protein
MLMQPFTALRARLSLPYFSTSYRVPGYAADSAAAARAAKYVVARLINDLEAARSRVWPGPDPQ